MSGGGAWASGILFGEMRRLAALSLSSLLGLARGTGTFLASDLPDLTPCLEADFFLSSECETADFLPAVFEP
jgi:hypothetical protein